MNTSPLPGKTISANFEHDGITWQDGGIMVLAFGVFEEEGKVAICGARSVDRKKLVFGENVNERAIENMDITLEGSTLVSNLRFFNRVPYPGNNARSLKGQANCRLTQRPWKPEFGILVNPELKRGPRRIVVQG